MFVLSMQSHLTAFYEHHLSRIMRKPTFCIFEIKAHISFGVTVKLIRAFVFATVIVQFVYFLKPKFPASSDFLCMYSLVFVGLGRKSHCWFSHDVADFGIV